MKPFLKLAKVWPWLPHFRVVAELESLSRAARKFGITSAALSKAIRTLEKLLAVELFDRAGGKLRLNEQGRALLVVVRASMRDIDDALTAIHTPSDSLRVAVDPALATIILASSSTNLELVHVPAEISSALVRGEVDAVVHFGRVVHADVDSAEIAMLERSVYGATEFLSPVEVGESAFLTLSRDEDRGQGAITLSSLAHAIAWVTSGRGAAVLPSTIARAFGLHPVAIALELAPVALWATIRRPRGLRSAAAQWRDSVREHCASI